MGLNLGRFIQRTLTTCPFVVCLLFPLACWPLSRKILLISMAPRPRQALQAGVSAIPWSSRCFLIPDILRNSQDLCPGRDARPGECFHCNCTKKSQRLWSKASAVLYLSVAWEMLAMNFKFSLFFTHCMLECLLGTRY